jgi:tetratricopeptide (TPR) repeat protein
MTHKHRSNLPKKLSANRSIEPIVLWRRSLAAMGDERWVDAIANLKLFLPKAEGVDKVSTYQNLGTCYLEMGLYDDSVSAFEEALKLSPDDSDLLLMQGVAYACQGKIKDAILNFETYKRRLQPRARQQSIKERLQLIRRIGRGEAPQNTYRYEFLMEQISHNLEVDDFYLVEHKAQEMISLLPNRPEGHFYLGVAYLETGRFQEGIDAYKLAVNLNPEHDVTRYNLAYALIKDGRVEEAIPHLELALQYNPKYLAAIHEMGVACDCLGRRDEAIQWWKKALKIDRGYQPAQWRLHEVGEDRAPEEPPLSQRQEQLRVMIPIAKLRMLHPTIVKKGDLTITYQARQGFVLEDSQNPGNGTIYLGGPFVVGTMLDEDLLDFMGVVKLFLRTMDATNTRDIAILVYYSNGDIFNYQAHYQRGKQVDMIADGQFRVQELPIFFKLRIDSDLPLPYVKKSQGCTIYLNQQPKPGLLITSMVV